MVPTFILRRSRHGHGTRGVCVLLAFTLVVGLMAVRVFRWDDV
jgi:hypothetical protein